MNTKFKEFYDFLDKHLKDRKWNNLPPEDLAKSIMIESAELLENFQWTNADKKSYPKADHLEKVSSEVADIFIYLLEFCMSSNIDILDVAFEKLKKVQKKYPVEELKKDSNFYYKQKELYRKNNKS